jgi:hypothetical protein
MGVSAFRCLEAASRAAKGMNVSKGEQEVGMNGAGADVAGANGASPTFIQHHTQYDLSISPEFRRPFDSSPPGFKPLTDAAQLAR